MQTFLIYYIRAAKIEYFSIFIIISISIIFRFRFFKIFLFLFLRLSISIFFNFKLLSRQAYFCSNANFCDYDSKLIVAFKILTKRRLNVSNSSTVEILFIMINSRNILHK